MLKQDLDARIYAQALARELPEAANLPAIQDASTASADDTQGSTDSLQHVLDASSSLLLCPEQTVRVARAMGPLLLDVVARALSLSRSAPTTDESSTQSTGQVHATSLSSPTSLPSSDSTAAERAETLLVVMSRLLPCAPYAFSLALEHWRSSPCPFDCLRGAHDDAAHSVGNAASDATRTAAGKLNSAEDSVEESTQASEVLKRIHAVTEAAQKLLSCTTLDRGSLQNLWNWSPFFDLCHHPDVLVRWRAVGVCSSLLGLDESGRRRLLRAVGASDSPSPDDEQHSWIESADTSKAGATAAHPQPRIQRPSTSNGSFSQFSDGTTVSSGRPRSHDDTEVLLNAALDLSEELRRAPSVLLENNWREAAPSPAENVEFNGMEGQQATDIHATASEVASAIPRKPFRHHPSVAEIGGILHAKISAPHHLHDRTADSSSTPLSRRGASRRRSKREQGLVSTASSTRNLATLSLAMTVNRPILLHGPAGSGKSLLAREAARLCSSGGNSIDSGDTSGASPALLELHLDDQTDSKSLLGAHACTDIPGEFAWRPGALTRAAAAGTWVLIEDLDRAPFEVLAAIGPLLEGRPLALPGRTKPLKAAPGFRIFGTTTTTGTESVILGGAADFGALWTHVSVEPLSMSEILEVATARHPSLPTPALNRLLKTMVAAKGNTGKERGGFGFLSRSSGGREPGVRDLLKLCARVETLGVFDEGHAENPVGKSDEDGGGDAWFCSEAQASPVVEESIDVFAGHLTSREALAHAAEVVAGIWNILPSKAVEMATTRRPELVQGADYLKIGRVTLPKIRQMKSMDADSSSSFAPTSHALRLMESLAASERACEPVLLVGETGCGKTALVQRLAEGTRRDLVVQNLSLQTDGTDLLGGFRPVEIRQLAQEVLEEFLRLFPLLFSANQNARFCQAVTSSFERRQWKRLSAGLRSAAKMALEKLDRARSEKRSEDQSEDPTVLASSRTSNKAQRLAVAGGSLSPSGQRRDWERFTSDADRFERQRVAVEGSFAFSFVEGVLVKAIREGKWVLLDEINLASAETLQRLSGLLEGSEGSLCLTERGDIDPVVRHPDFRLFAAMNPPTDASKKDLPPALRRRFSEVYVPELEDRLDLKMVVDGYISGISLEQEHLAFTAVDLYLWARGLAGEVLSDGAGQRPRYSLRTLVAAVRAARRLVDRGFSPKRAMVEGFRGAFETQLDGDGRAKILKGIMKAFGKGLTSKDLEKPPRRPGGRGSGSSPWVRIGPFWLEGGPRDPVDASQLDPATNQRSFVLTASVDGTLRCLARAVASADSPVLLQGPTSAGKTSMVEYLAKRLGHHCVRINNHEHTDIQEYTGSYAADGNGKLTFQEGVLVEALRQGHWIILDELNLAPSEVLEALNRLLDHNRELYLMETQETIKPHANFRLFATQNPPGAYGGRKPLSRAFRNRFMEVHVDDIPGSEWEVILAERCGLPPSHCKLLVKVLNELQAQRSSSRLFLGKHGAMSPRDLLRWAGRKPQGKEQLAVEGYMLLAERLRSVEEKMAMRAVLEEQIGATVDPACLYGTLSSTSTEHEDVSDGDAMVEDGVDESDLGGFAQLAVVESMLDKGQGLEAGLQGVAMTRHMRRLFRLSGRCLSHQEPLLLVGETGCGKTTVCQLYSMLLNRRMHVVNCHQNTEAADLLGGLRPLRGREVLVREFRERARIFLSKCAAATVQTNDENSCHRELAHGSSPSMDNVDVTSIMALVHAAWSKLQQAPPSDSRTQAESSTPTSSTPLQKRARRSDATEGRGIQESSPPPDKRHVSADAASVEKTSASTPSHDSTRPAKSNRAESRKREGASKRRRSGSGPSKDAGAPKLSPPPRRSDVPFAAARVASGDSSSLAVEERATMGEEFGELKALALRTQGLFEWADGPLVTAMRNGEMILLDELSLAEDAVLERLNSVLEPGRSITLAEKGGEGATTGQGAAETVVAMPGFRVMATMNPGGDFGKRELSPALRSRFTEVWVPALSDREDMEGVVQKAFRFGASPTACQEHIVQMAGPMLDFAFWFNNTASNAVGGGRGLSLSVRDLLSWAGFITSSVTPTTSTPHVHEPSSSSDVENHDGGSKSSSIVSPWEAYVHGAALVLLDGMGLGAGLSPASVASLRTACAKYLSQQIPDCPERSAALAQLAKDGGQESPNGPTLAFEIRSHETPSSSETILLDDNRPAEFGASPFFTPCGPSRVLGPDSGSLDFSLRAPTTARNLHRVLRALQVRKAVLLEGSPGVGKTSLISALAAATGHELVRINLSEQTDVSDLFGSDLPMPDTPDASSRGVPTSDGPRTDVGDGSNARFAWCDGVFLRALKAGKWVLLDELNLATQSVLEGLNACLDHRAEVYIPELGRTFRCPPTFKVFAAQNPLGQGGGRKGLPRSFLSRFTKVFVDPLTPKDLVLIASNKFPILAVKSEPDAMAVDAHPSGTAVTSGSSLLQRMIAFNSSVQRDTMDVRRYGQRGSPWEFNLRDVFRWCELIIREQEVVHGNDRMSAAMVRWEPWLVFDTLYIQRMRTRADRDALLSRFQESFPEAFSEEVAGSELAHGPPHHGGIGTHPSLRVSPGWMQIGHTVLRRGCWTDHTSLSHGHVPEATSAVPMPMAWRRPLQALARCVAMGWPALVVGDRGTGKTGLIEALAAGVGARLTEVAMTPSVDVTELLGCFEQTDASSEQDVLLEILRSLSEVVSQAILAGRAGARSAAGGVWDAWHGVERCFRLPLSPASDGGYHPALLAVDHLLDVIRSCVGDALLDGSSRASVALKMERAAAHTDTIRLQLKGVDRAHDSKAKAANSASCFRWSDGILVEALERGDWVVLDGANLCSASVLDRLNSLLEPGGVLLLTECGTSPDNAEQAEGSSGNASSHRVVRPHANFRLFLTADPACGEVSRAMRNRCVEVCLLDTPSAVVQSPSAEKTVSSDPPHVSSMTEHTSDLLALLHQAGLRHPREAYTAVAAHSALVARRSRARGTCSIGDGPAPRALKLWAELVSAVRSRTCFPCDDAMRLCWDLAYPGTTRDRGRFVGSGPDSAIPTAYANSPPEPRKRSLDVVDALVSSPWHEVVQNSGQCRAVQDSRVLKLALAFAADAQRAEHVLSALVVDELRSGFCTSDLCLEEGDETFICSPRDVANGGDDAFAASLVQHASAFFVRNADSGDRRLRCVTADRVSRCSSAKGTATQGAGRTVRWMMSRQWNASASRQPSSIMANIVIKCIDGDVEANVGGNGPRLTSLALSEERCIDAGFTAEVFHALRKACHFAEGWGSLVVLSKLTDIFVGQRLPILLGERDEIEDARSRIAAGRRGEGGLGWLGFACLVSEGGLDAAGAGPRRTGCPETRLARAALSPYLMSLLRGVDDVVSRNISCDRATLISAQGRTLACGLTSAVQDVLDARDSLSGVLKKPSSGIPGPDASAGASHELVFPWVKFLVAWRWLKQALDALQSTLLSSHLPESKDDVSAWAALSSVRAQVDAAVLEHAGGAAPSMDTLWKYGPRPAAPQTAAEATALGRLHRLSAQFCVRPRDEGHSFSLGDLMRTTHPALCVPLATRRELLHAHCTLHWASSTERGGSRDNPIDHIQSNSTAASETSLVERLPEVLEGSVLTARSRFEARHAGTRLGATEVDDGVGRDDTETGEQFDEFSTEAADAVAKATLVVVSGDDDDDGADQKGMSPGSVLRNWGSVQLSPLKEHWIAAEECDVIAELSRLGCGEGGAELHDDLGTLMSRIARLCSCMVSCVSFSPSDAMPYQTVLWAWQDSRSWQAIARPLLTRVLPVARESWGRRVWESTWSMPGVLSMQLSPPQLVVQASSSVDVDERGQHVDRNGAMNHGPSQILTLVRSSFLLRLTSTASFHGGVVPAGVVGRRDAFAVDLTLMNASARCEQFRDAMRSVRDLRYGAAGALRSLAELSWLSFRRTLESFDALRNNEEEVEGPTFGAALPQDSVHIEGEEVITRVSKALESCPDPRLAGHAETLVMPTVAAFVQAFADVGGGDAGRAVCPEGSTGLAMAFLGCLQLALLLPSSPVDPGLRPALKKALVDVRLQGLRAELTIRSWALRLDGRGNVSPEMVPLLKKGRGLREHTRRLEREAIERPQDRPSFHALFRDVHAFCKGIGNASRITDLAESLYGFVVPDGTDAGGVERTGVLREEAVWQGAAGAFVGRLREEYEDAYVDVVTGICDAVGVIRAGIRLLAAAVDGLGSVKAHVSSASKAVVPALAKLQTFLLTYPYSCNTTPTMMPVGTGDDLIETLTAALRPDALEGVDGEADAEHFRAQHMAVLEAVLSRAELLLSSSCSNQAAVDVVLKAMEAAVEAWSRLEAQEAEKRRKEAEILKYKMQEHVVASEEANDLAKAKALFPDYHSEFNDIAADSTDNTHNEDGDANATSENAVSDDDRRVRALGELTEKQLSSLVARHSRIFLSLSARRRLATRDLCGVGSTPGTRVGEIHDDAGRLVAHGDSYRAAVLLAGPTSRLPSSLMVPPRSGGDDLAGVRPNASEVRHLESEFAASHILALANAAKLSKSGESLLEQAVETFLASRRDSQKGGNVRKERRIRPEMTSVWRGIGGQMETVQDAAARNLLFVDSFSNFHLDSNVMETRLADGPLASVLKRVAGLLGEFPGHGVLIQVARVADRVRRMPLHSPLAAVLAGVELTLRKAQDWEQHAHRGVSLKEELRALSALVVRWRAVELKSWPQLLDARESSFVAKASRWWLHLYRLLTGQWEGHLTSPDGVPPEGPASSPVAMKSVDSVEKPVASAEWRVARASLPDWLWVGLEADNAAAGGNQEGHLVTGALAHARGLFQPLDDFLRTSNVGEFPARLQMLRAFSAQLSSSMGRTQPLGTVVQGLWQYYSQFTEEVAGARELVRTSIEKKLKEEAKLAKWDEQTYYSLAESSEKSHRKLSKLVSQYDEVLEVSVSEILHRTLIAGIGERSAGDATPSTDIPTLGSIFSVVKKLDSASDFNDDDAEETLPQEEQRTANFEGEMDPPPSKPSKNVLKRRSSKTSASPSTSLRRLDACVPSEPRATVVGAVDSSLTPWLEEALTAASLTSRIPSLSQRMRTLLRRSVYGRHGRGQGTAASGWADAGRPAGFVGAGVSEELCLAVFSRIEALRVKAVGKQVKKRAVLDLLGGMRKQGLRYAKSATPPQTSDMLHVMALAQPLSSDRLVGVSDACLFVDGEGKCGISVDLLERAERYFLRGTSEMMRLRLEAGAPVSRDITRREAEVMRGLAEHLGFVVLQQRGGIAALESDLLSLMQEAYAIKSVTTNKAACHDAGALSTQALGDTSSGVRVSQQALPPQRTVRLALEAQETGLWRGLEAVREVKLLLTAMVAVDPPTASDTSGDASSREGWGQSASCASDVAECRSSILGLEKSIAEMVGRIHRYTTRTESESPTRLLSAAAAEAVLGNQGGLRTCAASAESFGKRYMHVAPVAVFARISSHLSVVVTSVESALHTCPIFATWIGHANVSGEDCQECMVVDTEKSSEQQQAAIAAHVTRIGNLLSEGVKTMLLSVQALRPSGSGTEAESDKQVSGSASDAGGGGEAGGEGEETDGEGWSTDTTLVDAHRAAFEQAQRLKLWRCSAALSVARGALQDFTEDETLYRVPGRDEAVREAGEALVLLSGEVMGLVDQVLAAGKALLVGMIAMNKGTAKLHYVIVRVFRTLLSKGLCADETEELEGDGDGDIDGMKFDDDVEGTGMGEGEGKKDVTDQIEDEEQLLGLKGDEPDKDHAEEAKELGEDEQDKGMEMENDFEGEMFDVPKGEEKEDDEREEDDNKEELDREMGDIGDNADVVDEKLWDEDDDDDGDEDGKDQQGEEKFEEGSRLDGEQPEEDEIRTKEDGQDKEKDKADDAQDEDESKGQDEKTDKEKKDGGEGEAEGNDEEGKDEVDDGEGPVNDDLEDNYEDKPMGVEVRGEDEALEVDEEGRDMEADEGDEGQDKDDEDLPDEMDLDNAQEGEDGSDAEDNERDDQGNGEEDGDNQDNQEDDQEQDKEGFETLGAEEDDQADDGEELKEDEQQPQGAGNAGAPEMDPMDEGHEDEDEEKGDEDDEEGHEKEEEKRKVDDAAEPPAFGVQGEGGDSSVLEAVQDEVDGKAAEEDEKHGEERDEEKEQGQDGGGNAEDGVDDGGAGGQGEDGQGGEWRRDMSGGEGRGQGQGNDKSRRPEAPNPFRDPGDAMRHWHRRLDMLQDKESADDDGRDGPDDGAKDEGKDGKFEYVTGNDKGSSQVLGAVSEEQAAEAAAEQTQSAEENAVDDEAEDNSVGGVETMEDDELEERHEKPADEKGLRADGADSGEANRMSGRRRDTEGHEADADDDDKSSRAGEDTPVLTPDKAPVELDSLDEPLSGGADGNSRIVSNPLVLVEEDEDEEEPEQNPRGREARLREELHTLAVNLQLRKRDREGSGNDESNHSKELWGRLRAITGGLSQRLCEQLRLVLEPMVATKLQGDYRSGKRINMRRVISYIASGFRKDKIWLRRTKPAKRDYQILIAIDDSESMEDCGAGALALAAMTTVALGLTQLEAGQLGVARFGENLDLLHGFGEPFTEDAGAKIVDGFTFSQPRTNTAHTLEGVVSLLEEARSGFSFSSGGVGSKGMPRQLVLLMSDGRFDRENKDRLRKLVREMQERGQLLVLIVLDKEGDTSILKTREASYVNGKLAVKSYLDKYPFPLYILLNHIEALPETLADALRQWFELLQRQAST